MDGWRDAGFHEVTFDGSKLASGIYMARLQAGTYSKTCKMVLIVPRQTLPDQKGVKAKV